jgi:parallel beta-helix repeat protein
MNGTASCTFGRVSVGHNTVDAGDAGIHTYLFENFGDLSENASAVIGAVTIDNNTVTGQDGIVIDHVDAGDYTITDNATFVFGGIRIDDNTISDCQGTPSGIHVEYSNNLTVSRNLIHNCSTGIYVEHASHNGFFHNLIYNCSFGFYVNESCNHTVIENNTVKENHWGIYVYGGTYPYHNTDTEIHWNNIYGNTFYGLWYDMYMEGLSRQVPYLNATYNWWGAVNGPGSAEDRQTMQDPVTGWWASGNGDWLYGGSEYDNIHFDPWVGIGRMLYEGWNMISPTFIEGVYDAAGLADYINMGGSGPERGPVCTVVTRWDATTHTYQSYVVGFGGNFALENGSGYMVFMTEDMNMPIYGAVLEPEINQTLIAGYNLIGWPYPYAIAASELAENISYSVKIAFLDAETQTWLPEYIVGLPVPWDFDVQMSEGVFVFVSDETTYAWTGMPSFP